MRYLTLCLLGFFGIILRDTVFTHLVVAGARPDFVLIVVILFALFNGPNQGGIAGIMLGLMEDLLIGRYIGLNALCKGAIGFFIGFLNDKIYKENFSVPIFSLFFGTIGYVFIYFLTSNIIGNGMSIVYCLQVVFPMAIYNSCLTPFIYGMFYNMSTKGILKGS